MNRCFLASIMASYHAFAFSADCTANVQESSKTQIADLKAAIRCLAQENARLREGAPPPNAPSVPSGAVVAFRAVSCPNGWAPYQRGSGRVIVGVGAADGKDFLFEEIGGKVATKLTVANLPPHQHDTSVAIGEANNAPFGLGPAKRAVFGTQIAPLTTGMTSPVGESAPFSTLPPYISLLYCEKR